MTQRDITGTDIEQFPVAEVNGELLQGIPKVFDSLRRDYYKNSFMRERKDCEFQEFQPSKSKTIIDEKYRLGAEAKE